MAEFHPVAEGEPTEAPSVPVCFFTACSTLPQSISEEQTFAVPLSTLPEGLNTLVNELLSLQQPVLFDFLVGDDYITTSLERFMRRRHLTVEETLRIEYTPAMQAQEGSKLPHDDWVSSVQGLMLGDPRLLLTGAYDHCVRVWNGDDCLSIGTGHAGAVREVRVHPQRPAASAAATADHKRAKKSTRRSGASEISDFEAISAGKDGYLLTWRYSAAEQKLSAISTTHQHTDAVDTVDIHRSGEWVATGSWDCSAKVFRWDELKNTPAPSGPLSTLGHSGRGAAAIFNFTDHARAVLKVRFSATNDNRLYTAGLDGSVKVWDMEKGALHSTLSGEHAIQGMAVQPAAHGDGDLIATGHTDNRLRLFDVRAKGAVKTWNGHRQWVYAVCWRYHKDEPSPAAPLLISGSEDATLRVWDLRSTNAALLTLDLLHTDGILDVAYLGNNEVASGGKDNRTKTTSLRDSVAALH